MAIWRKNIFPRCPVCHESSSHAGHKDCPADGKLWVDILTGTIKCDQCGKAWSLEKSENYCSCGTVFEGGEIWQGMHSDFGFVRNFAWFRRLYHWKGTLRTRVIG